MTLTLVLLILARFGVRPDQMMYKDKLKFPHILLTDLSADQNKAVEVLRAALGLSGMEIIHDCDCCSNVLLISPLSNEELTVAVPGAKEVKPKRLDPSLD